MSMFI
jgi:hypothetical protein